MNTRSTERQSAGRGWRLPARLATLILSLGSGHGSALELAATLEQRSSAGLVERRHWAQGPLHESADQVIATARSALSMSHSLGGWVITATTGQRATFSGHANVLTLAAAADSANGISLPVSGRYALDGKAQTLRSTDIGLARVVLLGEDTTLVLKPYLARIHEYQRVEGSGSILAQNGTTQVVGTVQRVGTRSYGFLVQDRPDRGWGAGLDLSLALRRGAWQLDVEAVNVWQQLRFSDVHWSDRTYNVAAVNGNLVIRGPGEYSMTGVYGVARRNERLPMHATTWVRHAALPGWRGGLFTLGHRAYPMLGYGRTQGPWTFGLETVGGRNLAGGIRWTTADRRFAAGLGVTVARGGGPLLSQAELRWHW